jgi:integrase
VRSSTLEDYAATIRVHLDPHIGRRRAQTLTRADVAGLRSTLLRQTGVRSTQLALLRLSQVLAWGVSLELLTRNVAAGVKGPAGKAGEKRALSHAEAQAFLEIAESDTYSPLWRLYLATGLRRGEGLGLRWKDVDLHAHTLSVRQQVVISGTPAQPTLQEPKSPAARRTIDLDALTVNALSVHGQRQQVIRKAAPLWKNLDLVFCTKAGTPINPNNLLRSFAVLRELAGLDPGITIHTLRHTHATHLLLAGVPVSIVAARLGHKDASVTLDVYSHVLPGSGGMALEAISAALDGELPALG